MTPAPITREQLDAWEELAKAATPGPWGVSTGYGEDSAEAVCMAPGVRNYLLDVVVRSGRDGGTDNTVEDAAFIAAAREAVPALIARVKELEGWT